MIRGGAKLYENISLVISSLAITDHEQPHSSFSVGQKFHRDLPPTKVFAFGTSSEEATVPGPTIEALDSVPSYVTWENHLPHKHILPWDPTIPTAVPKRGVPTAVHLHGGIQSPQSDGNPLAWFTANFSETGPAWSRRTYTYPNQHQLPGNLWYHDHALGITRTNLLVGLLGAYVVRSPEEEAPLGVPTGKFDRHLMIFDRTFNKDGSVYVNTTGVNPNIHPIWQPEYFGDTILVNGRAWPYLKVQKRKYRFRILNACNARYLNLSLSNGMALTQLASDSAYLPHPITLTSVLLAPAEIADVVVDFSVSTTRKVALINDAVYPFPSGDPPDSRTGKVMMFLVKSAGRTPLAHEMDNSRVPQDLISYPSAICNEAVKTRYIVFYEYGRPTGAPTHLYINGWRFEDPATEKPAVGSTEVWKVINLTPDNHPLHIHLAVFQAVEQRELVGVEEFMGCMTVENDALKCNVSEHATGQVVPVPMNERTWKNVVKMAPSFMTTVVVKFGFVHCKEPYPFDATAYPGYVYHCHILDHEDNSMMRPLVLVRK
ncbi:Spore coat protein [Nymphaea thermarum]|nr:Spore coat protein [Nymphaea thermarum]